MQHTLDLCVYCERSPDELLLAGEVDDALEALVWVKVGDVPLLLCHSCTENHTQSAPGDFLELFDGPIDFPPGVTAVSHTCPELEYQGKRDEEATFVMEMHRKSDYYEAACEYCGVEVRSKAVKEVDSPFGSENDESEYQF